MAGKMGTAVVQCLYNLPAGEHSVLPFLYLYAVPDTLLLHRRFHSHSYLAETEDFSYNEI